MKAILILTTIVTGTLATTGKFINLRPNALMQRAIDPTTMDPTRLSVLSVLKTAMPTGTTAVMPTDTEEPQWYAQLPEDVKSLLPVLYPATPVESATVSQTSSIPPAHISLTKTPEFAPTTVSNLSDAPLHPTGGVATSSVNGTVSADKPSPTSSEYFSTGARTDVEMEKFAGVLWVVVGAGFFLLA